MRYRIEYAEGKCCSFAEGSKELIKKLKILKGERITDIRKVHKSGVSGSVLDVYQKKLGGLRK